ncbi:gamma-type small acid-soluble spore protein [Aneurinibacillus terranovensis]|uniref:gamma-type small acid-soluble spore protein n=1 Tax=Aneurinibacillus terranovensis TaxID=278991 RepID=UPI0004099FD6|nr:gamma-type small acid-soluble spore protein [Aneurinibacillus terranovensis]
MSKRVKFNLNREGVHQQTNQASPGKLDSEFASETDTQAVRLAKSRALDNQPEPPKK